MTVKVVIYKQNKKCNFFVRTLEKDKLTTYLN